MAGFRDEEKTGQDTTVSADFHHALMQEVMTTELLRIKVLIGIAVVFSVTSSVIYFTAPDALVRVWHGNFKPSYLYSVIVPFILFELWVHSAIIRH